MTRPLKGRGAISNPDGRFSKFITEAVDDGWFVEQTPSSIATAVEPDHARSIISTNSSPDIPFEYSINPYRGCEHGCVYCMAGDTRVSMADGTTRALAEVRAGDAICGTVRQGAHRRYTEARVLMHWSVVKPAYRITLQDGTTLVAGPDHRFLTDRGWKFVTGTKTESSCRPHLTTGSQLMGIAPLGARLRTNADDSRGHRSGQQALLRALRFELGVERNVLGQAVETAPQLRIVDIEPLNRAMRLYDLTTSTGDFIADGVVSHNCYARPSHAYLGLSPGLDFETRLFYKPNAARLLAAELARPGYVCKPITLGANTDPYQPLEKRLGVTRSILEVLRRFRHPCAIVTKGILVLRDLDLIAPMAREGLASVAVSLTTLDAELKRSLEPRAAAPLSRITVIRELAAAGVPTGVLVAPVIPALNDHELEAILAAAAEAGAVSAGYVLLRLPHELSGLWREWLAQHYPQRARHVMSVLAQTRGGRDNDPRFGARMSGTGPYAQMLRLRFEAACRRLQIDSAGRRPLSTALFEPPGARQLGLDF